MLDLTSRLDLGWVVLQCGGKSDERAREIARRLGADARDLPSELDSLRRIGLGFAEDLERADEPRPVGALLVDRLEDAPRLRAQIGLLSMASSAHPGALMPHVEEQDLAVVLERTDGVGEVLLQGLPEAELQVDELVLPRSSSIRRRRIRRTAPTARLGVEHVERRQGGRVGRLVIEHGR